jgi:coproporphyrinogen III oxidase
LDHLDTESFRDFLLKLQKEICATLESLEPSTVFQCDQWDREKGGSGVSKVIADGDVFEKAGVNFSHVFGKSMPPSATVQRPELAGKAFEAMGVSLVIHPRNPFVPTSHANFRLFVAHAEEEKRTWWFGGGYDLTPYYGNDDDCTHWHQTAKSACESYGGHYYPQFKKQCDDYFYLKHRDEPRGIGGIFFDDFNELEFQDSLKFVQNLANSYLKAYLPIVNERKNTSYTKANKEFQEYRRGRYVEFNLVYDRGTVFGLQSGVGRIESILMSLPPTVRWTYDWKAELGSEEEKLYQHYLKPQAWV